MYDLLCKWLISLNKKKGKNRRGSRFFVPVLLQLNQKNKNSSFWLGRKHRHQPPCPQQLEHESKDEPNITSK